MIQAFDRMDVAYYVIIFYSLFIKGRLQVSCWCSVNFVQMFLVMRIRV